MINEKTIVLRERINHNNTPKLNRTFQIQIGAIRSAATADDLENVEALIMQKKNY